MDDNRIEGRVRESADGLRQRSSEAEKAQLREARHRLAEEAAAQRKERKEEERNSGD